MRQDQPPHNLDVVADMDGMDARFQGDLGQAGDVEPIDRSSQVSDAQDETGPGTGGKGAQGILAAATDEVGLGVHHAAQPGRFGVRVSLTSN